MTTEKKQDMFVFERKKELAITDKDEQDNWIDSVSIIYLEGVAYGHRIFFFR